MEKINSLNPGQIFINEELMNIFKCSGQGGMRRSIKTNSLVLVSNHIQSIYDDRWEGNILYYTGMGTEGDQSFNKSQNKTLYESKTNKLLTVYLFEVFEPQKYTYIGEVALANNFEPFYEDQIDKSGTPRRVCIFPLEIVRNAAPFIDKKILDKHIEIQKKRIKSVKIDTLTQLAKCGAKTPGIRNIYSTQFIRNQAVSELAKHIAYGVCQLCKKEAPFKDKQGVPFLEVHHIKWLSEGGSDTLDNVIALCPNCHKKMHIINNKEDREFLRIAVIQLLTQNNLF